LSDISVSTYSPTEPAPVDHELCISVIIPVLNEETVIGRCLESLLHSRLPKDQFEVIVVDNGSRDRTLEVVKTFEDRLALKILTLEKAHISALRNRGASQARGAILAFLDADCLAPPEWLTTASETMNNSDAGICGAHYCIPDDATWVGRIWTDDRLHGKEQNVSYVPAGVLIIRADAFRRLGGFDESIQTNEDFELCQRVIEDGLPVRSYPSLGVVHLGTPRTLADFFRKHRWHGTHVFSVFLRDPQKRKNRRVVLLSIYTLMCISGILIGIALAVAEKESQILVCFVVLFALPIVAIAAARSIPRGRWVEFPALALLYLTFCVARANSLVKPKSWRTPKDRK
jgi:glycosyltransferase involved in cell wall biosynthesis